MPITNQLHFFFRTLAPAGGFSSPSSILNAKRELTQIVRHKGLQLKEVVEQYLAQEIAAQEVISFGSGKESLLACFQVLRKTAQHPGVGVSAYTCPDIAVACARAGFKVLPLEVKDTTLDINFAAHSAAELSGLSAVVLSNLYGLTDNPAPALALAQSTGCAVIDDACQALLSRRMGTYAGTLPDSYGVLSFGRGKAVCGAGGGAVVIPRKAAASAAASQTANQLPIAAEEVRLLQLNTEDGARCILDCLSGFVSWCLERPWLYWLPAGLPFLGLGKTVPDLAFRKAAITESKLLHAYAQFKDNAGRAKGYVEKAKEWSDSLRDTGVIQPFLERGFDFSGAVVPIRYPLIFPSTELREQAFRALQKFGLGASCSYPRILAGYPELKDALIESNTPAAASVAARILTLPVHRYVRKADIARGTGIIRQVLG